MATSLYLFIGIIRGHWPIDLLSTLLTSLITQLLQSLPAMQRPVFDPWVGKIPWRRAWQATPVLPGESLGQRSLAGYSPGGHKESGLSTYIIYLYLHLYLYIDLCFLG